jgi:hypothetical protein
MVVVNIVLGISTDERKIKKQQIIIQIQIYIWMGSPKSGENTRKYCWLPNNFDEQVEDIHSENMQSFG